MKEPLAIQDARARHRITEMCSRGPVFVEVSFRGCGTSSDWHLCQNEEELNALLQQFPAGREFRLFEVEVLTRNVPTLHLRKTT